MERFIKRTWRQTSEKICLANDIPPGFRIVLLDEDGRVKRDDLLVRSGRFGGYPGNFRIWGFVDEAIKNHVKDADCLDYADAQLRDDRGKPVDLDLTLRRVRDMPGTGRKYTKASKKNGIIIDEVESEIEDALGIFDEDERVAYSPGRENCLLLKALIQYIISHFEIGELEDVLDSYKAVMEKRALKGG
jgi:hypothetical protein